MRCYLSTVKSIDSFMTQKGWENSLSQGRTAIERGATDDVGRLLTDVFAPECRILSDELPHHLDAAGILDQFDRDASSTQ